MVFLKMFRNSMEVETTLDQWSVQILNAKGQWEKVIFPFIKTLLEAGVPELGWSTRNISFTFGEAGMNILTKGRLPAHEVFAITMTNLRGYAVLVDVRDLGENLMVSWKLIFNRFELSILGGFAHWKGWIDATKITPYKEQQLTILKTITLDTLKLAVKNCVNQVDEDFSVADERSRGIESIDVETLGKMSEQVNAKDIKESVIEQELKPQELKPQEIDEDEKAHGIETIHIPKNIPKV